MSKVHRRVDFSQQVALGHQLVYVYDSTLLLWFFSRLIIYYHLFGIISKNICDELAF